MSEKHPVQSIAHKNGSRLVIAKSKKFCRGSWWARAWRWVKLCPSDESWVLKWKEDYFIIRNNKAMFGPVINDVKWYGPNRSRRYLEEVARIHRRTVQKRSS